MDARETRAAAVGTTLPNTREPAAEADHSRQLYETQLRLNGRLVNEIADCKAAYAAQAAELAELRHRDKATADLMEAHRDLLAEWSDHLNRIEGQVIDLMDKALQDEAAQQALAGRATALRATRRVEALTNLVAPVQPYHRGPQDPRGGR